MQQFRNEHARHVGRHRAERPAIFAGRVRLGIVTFELARPAVEPDENHRFAGVRRGPFGPHPQQIGERQAGQTEQAGFDRRAAGGALAVGGGGAGVDLEHGGIVRGRWSVFSCQYQDGGTYPQYLIG